MAIVYQHIRKDNNEIFYIGIGKNENRAKSKSRNNPYWHNIVKKYGYIIEILYYDLDWKDACIKEIELIKKYGRKDLGNGTLVNLTDGGEGTPNIGPETLKKISRLGYKHSDEVKKRISESGKLWKRNPMSQEQKQKLSKLKKGNKLRLGSILTDEIKNKISNAHKKLYNNGYVNPTKGIKFSEERIKKMSETMIGKYDGEKNPNSKLTLEQVNSIRKEYIPFSKKYGTKQLSKKYNISIATINKIVQNKIWLFKESV
jgi:hypothetical protein